MGRDQATVRVITRFKDIDNAGNIALYGTGGMGRKVFAKIKQSCPGITVTCFFSTVPTEQLCCGLPIFAPQQISANKALFNFILITSAFYSEILTTLNQYNYHNIIVFDDDIYAKQCFHEMYNSIYPLHGLISITGLAYTENNARLSLQIKSNYPQATTISHSIYDVQEVATDKSTVELQLDQLPPDKDFHPLHMRMEDSSGQELCAGSAFIRYLPAQKSDAFLEPMPTIIELLSSDIHCFPHTALNDWGKPEPSPEDMAFASKEWSAIINLADDFRKAEALTIELCRVLWNVKGVPSHEVRMSSPFEQYRLAKAGNSKIWCENYATILNHALNCLGIPARRIYLCNQTPETNGVIYSTGSGHQCVEYYNKDTNEWIWVDPYFNILSANFYTDIHLNVMEFSWNLTRRRDHIGLRIWSPEHPEPLAISFNEFKEAPYVAAFYSINQAIRFNW